MFPADKEKITVFGFQTLDKEDALDWLVFAVFDPALYASLVSSQVSLGKDPGFSLSCMCLFHWPLRLCVHLTVLLIMCPCLAKVSPKYTEECGDSK